ncbi:MAG: ABC-F family ATP-binding cassette domain-containing protein [Deltaproteobacteria bacterium]|nr:ABC-F family ATP-binding cassette domain-containing protein [Deltaproteobacteria bacterium]
MLQIAGLTYRVGTRFLFEGATAHVPVGHRVGLVGRNGSGKTTLLKLIAGALEIERGSLALRRGARVGVVAQDAPDGPRTPLETVLAADEERTRLLAEAEAARDPHRIAEIHTRLADMGAHAAPARAASILAGLGFDEEAQARPLSHFSGGFRMRVALAAVLFAEPDLLLLDEPTNHLDLEASLWLESHLRTYPHTLLIVSHDREFLNTVATRILHIEGGKLAVYSGGYDAFERARRETLERTAVMVARQDDQRRRMEAFIARFKAKATKARQAQSRMKALARMEPIAAVMEERAVAFSFPEPEAVPSPVIRLESAEVGYEPGRPVLRGLSLSVYADDRIALLGANGNGKTTLTRLFSGRLRVSGGEMTRTPRLRVGYFAQNQLEELRVGRTPIEELSALMPGAPEERVRTRLGGFGFGGDKALVRVADLSGGEKARLALCLIAHCAPHLLILDEPTNHLDLDSREALVQALNDYKGAVILVSHDRHLVETVADRLWLVARGTALPFEGDMDEYRSGLLAERSPASRTAEGAEGGGQERAGRKETRRAAAAERARLAPLKGEARAAEEALEALTDETSAVDRELSDPATYAGSEARVAELGRRKRELERLVAEAEARWIAAHEALEAALAQAPGDGSEG